MFGEGRTLLKPACQRAGTWYVPSGSISPYFLLNWSNASLGSLAFIPSFAFVSCLVISVLSSELNPAKTNTEYQNNKALTEVTQQANIISLHTNTSTNQDTPRYGLRIELDTLKQRHLVLFLCRVLGIVDDFIHALGVSEVISLWEVEGPIGGGGDIVGFGFGHGGDLC